MYSISRLAWFLRTEALRVLLMFRNDHSSLSLSDQEALPQPHQAPNERIHGILTHREKGDRGAQPRYSQR